MAELHDHSMTAGKLREIMKDLPDETRVVVFSYTEDQDEVRDHVIDDIHLPGWKYGDVDVLNICITREE